MRHLSPAAMLAALNDQLQERKLDAQYVTMLMALWDDNNQTLQIANAGSVQPVFVTNTTGDPADRIVKTIEAEGFPLGLFPGAEYEEFTFSTQPGDLIVFFSDGIVDAENATGEMFGTTASTMSSKPSTPHRRVHRRRHPRSAVTDFQAGTEHFDDETVVVLRVARSLQGSLTVPGDKSISHRYAMLAGLAEGTTRLSNFSTGADPRTPPSPAWKPSAQPSTTGEGKTIEVTGTAGKFSSPQPLDCGNSGSTMRMLSGLIAPHPHTFTLIGDHSLTLRPMERIRKPLSQMGAKMRPRRRPRPHHHPRRPAPGHRLRHPHPLRPGQDRRPLRRPPGQRHHQPLRIHPHPRPLRARPPRLRCHPHPHRRKTQHPRPPETPKPSTPPSPATSPPPPSSSAPRFSSPTPTSSSTRSA
jgi:hypothetical protein